MDEHIYKSHNKTLLMYHLVFPAKYRRKVFTEEVEKSLKEVCEGISERYKIRFVEIGLEEDHVHFLVQGIPTITVSKLVKTIKSITAREIFKRHSKSNGKYYGEEPCGRAGITVGQYGGKIYRESREAG